MEERRRSEPDPGTMPSDLPTTPPDPPWWEREQGRLHGGRGRRVEERRRREPDAATTPPDTIHGGAMVGGRRGATPWW